MEWVCLAGVGFVVLLIPLNKLLAEKIAKASSSLMGAKDERISSMASALRSIFTLRACVRADPCNSIDEPPYWTLFEGRYRHTKGL